MKRWRGGLAPDPGDSGCVFRGRAVVRGGEAPARAERGRAARPPRRGDPRAARGPAGAPAALGGARPGIRRRSSMPWCVPRTSASSSTRASTGVRSAMPRSTPSCAVTPRGASTLSMQVAAMLEPQLKAAGTRRTVAQKWDQIRAARELEKTLDQAPDPRGLSQSVDLPRRVVRASARRRAGCSARMPAASMSARPLILAALLRGPNAKPETVARRACLVAGHAKSCDSASRQLAAAHLTAVPRIAGAGRHSRRTWRASCCRRDARACRPRSTAPAGASRSRRCSGSWRSSRARRAPTRAVLVLDNASGRSAGLCRQCRRSVRARPSSMA